MSSAEAQFDSTQEELMAEQCILLDEQDNCVGKNTKRFCHNWQNIEEGKALHRAFSVFLFNSKDELLLQQRSAEKITFPLRWTNTCCSHPLHIQGEVEEEKDSSLAAKVMGVKRAAIRKLEHELGIPTDVIAPEEITFVSRIIYKAPSDDVNWGEHEIDYLLFIKKDVDEHIKIVENEVCAVQWVNPEQLKSLIATRDENNIMISPWFHMIVDQFGYKWWDNLDAILANDGLSDKTEAESIHPVNITDSITS
jgi:isopentenyl-diphosphate delta-isomerase